jgi:hypothetical protein
MMNNKSRKDVMIHQLAKRAGQGNPYHIPPEFVVEFAEHIIDECIGVVIREEYRYDADPHWEMAQAINEHFGMK